MQDKIRQFTISLLDIQGARIFQAPGVFIDSPGLWLVPGNRNNSAILTFCVFDDEFEEHLKSLCHPRLMICS